MTELALTLSDYAASPKPLVAGVAKVLRENSKIMDILPFEDVGSLSVKVVREGGMPDTSWRNVGEAHGSAKASKPDEVQESAYSIGNSITVDKVYMKDRSARLYNPMTYQTTMVSKAIARNFTDKLINGLPSEKVNPVGLWYRLVHDMGSAQSINGASVDISSDASSLSTNLQKFLDRLDELLYAVTDSVEAGGDNVFFITNDTVMLRYQSIARQSGILNTVTDALGRTFTDYKGAKFIDAGFKYDEATRIMGNVELANGSALSGGTCSSIYAVKVGKEYFTGWQEYALEVSDPMLDTADLVTYRSVIDWVVGLAVSHPRSIARLYGVVAA